MRKAKKSARTCNLALTVLRNVLKMARRDGHIKWSPADGLEWFKVDSKAHRLYSPDEIERLITAGSRAAEDGAALKNAKQFADYLRFLQYTGAREQEALRIRWADVDLDQGHVVIGSDGDSKNRESRVVVLNPQLRAHLEGMSKRKAPDTEWLFPSAQRGEKDKPAKTFRESLKLARIAAGLPDFGFHDLRRFFASRAVMSGIDFMCVAEWLGHKDKGLLVAKTYAHLADSHKKQMADKLVFSPIILEKASNS
jgi:integrase